MGMVGMVVYVCLAIGLVALLKGSRIIWRRQNRFSMRDPLRCVFGSSELRELDEHLDRIAAVEQLRIDATLARYVAGIAGHVVVISESPHGVALGLSDGRRLALGSVSRSTMTALKRRAAQTRLYPARVERDSFTYRLLLRDEAGADIELSTRRLALAP